MIYVHDDINMYVVRTTYRVTYMKDICTQRFCLNTNTQKLYLVIITKHNYSDC